jgi:hypothetical protein
LWFPSRSIPRVSATSWGFFKCGNLFGSGTDGRRHKRAHCGDRVLRLELSFEEAVYEMSAEIHVTGVEACKRNRTELSNAIDHSRQEAFAIPTASAFTPGSAIFARPYPKIDTQDPAKWI